MYDRITGDHFLRNSIAITSLTKKYYDHYRNLGGIYDWDTNIRIDFMIVACASFNGLDIVYSDDQKTMLGKVALKACQNRQGTTGQRPVACSLRSPLPTFDHAQKYTTYETRTWTLSTGQ